MSIVISYAAYPAIGLALTVWVAGMLRRNGRLLLADAFRGDAKLGEAAKRLLLIGFYLVNLGYLTLSMSASASPENAQMTIEKVKDKVGGALVVLGITHFVVLFAFHQLRGRERSGHARAGFAGGGWSPENAPLGKVLE
jgi:uncharacterized membrane protein